MTGHLDDSTLSAALASSSLGQQALEHLDSCIVCRRRLKQFQDTVDERRRQLIASAPDFEKQKGAILSRLVSGAAATAPKHRIRWVRPVLAAAATIMVFVGAGLLKDVSDRPLIPTPRPDLPIEEILAQTEALLADDTIPGFAVFDEFSEIEIDTLLADQSSKL